MAVLFYAVRLESGEMFPKRLETPAEAIALAKNLGDSSVAVSVHYITPCAWCKPELGNPLQKLRGSHTCCRTCQKVVMAEIQQLRESLAVVA